MFFPQSKTFDVRWQKKIVMIAQIWIRFHVHVVVSCPPRPSAIVQRLLVFDGLILIIEILFLIHTSRRRGRRGKWATRRP